MNRSTIRSLFVAALLVGAVGAMCWEIKIAASGPAGQMTCTPPPSGMISSWPADGNANDIQDGNNGTLQNGANFAPAAGRLRCNIADGDTANNTTCGSCN
jgi:hypothetical protein